MTPSLLPYALLAGVAMVLAIWVARGRIERHRAAAKALRAELDRREQYAARLKDTTHALAADTDLDADIGLLTRIAAGQPDL